VTVVIWTFGEMFIFPSAAAYVTDVSDPERMGEYSGLFAMSFSVAYSVGPWAGTLVLDRFGGRALWAGTFVLGLVAAAMISRLPDPPRHAEITATELPETAGPAAV